MSENTRNYLNNLIRNIGITQNYVQNLLIGLPNKQITKEMINSIFENLKKDDKKEDK